MSEKRFKFGIVQGSRQAHIKDCETCKSATIDVYDDNIKYFVELLNTLHQENQQLKEDLEFNMRTEIAHHRVIEQELKEENEALKKFIKDNFNEMMDSKMVIDDE